MKSFILWIARACEEERGVPSSTRVVLVFGSFSVLTTFLVLYIASFIINRPLPEVTYSVGSTFLSFLAAMLGAKVIQKDKEAAGPTS